MNFKDKYLKYKHKYLKLKNQNAGALTNDVIKHLTDTINDWLNPSSEKVYTTLSIIFDNHSLESDNFIHTLLSRSNEFDKDIIKYSYKYLLDNNKIFNIMNLDGDSSIKLIHMVYPDIIDLLKPSSSSENPCQKLIHSTNIYKNSIYKITAYMLVIRTYCNGKDLDRRKKDLDRRRKDLDQRRKDLDRDRARKDLDQRRKDLNQRRKDLDLDTQPIVHIINSLLDICNFIKTHTNRYYLFAFTNIILGQFPDVRDYLTITVLKNENDEKIRLTLIDLMNCLANELDKNELIGDIIFKEYFQTNFYNTWYDCIARIFVIEPRLIKYLTTEQRESLLYNYSHEIWAVGETNPESIAKIAEYLYSMELYQEIRALYKYHIDKLPKHMTV